MGFNFASVVDESYQRNILETMQILVDEGLWTWIQKAHIIKEGQHVGTETADDDYLLWTLRKR